MFASAAKSCPKWLTTNGAAKAKTAGKTAQESDRHEPVFASKRPMVARCDPPCDLPTAHPERTDPRERTEMSSRPILGRRRNFTRPARNSEMNCANYFCNEASGDVGGPTRERIGRRSPGVRESRVTGRPDCPRRPRPLQCFAPPRSALHAWESCPCRLTSSCYAWPPPSPAR